MQSRIRQCLTRSVVPVVGLLLLVQPVAYGQSVVGCGKLTNHYGPFDYTSEFNRREKLPPVEQYHFDVGVQALKGLVNVAGGEIRLGADISYTLRAFPNHHLALYTMIRYYIEKVPKGASRMLYDPPCWFDRAKRFAPHDATVVMLEGIYYQKSGELGEAKAAYEKALEMDPNSAEINYNAGLLYITLEDYDRASACATRAYELGYPLPGLRRKLLRLGVWDTDADS